VEINDMAVGYAKVKQENQQPQPKAPHGNSALSGKKMLRLLSNHS
jgi:hypothetical protein